MFQTQKRDKILDISILNKLSDDLTNAITSSKLAYYRRIAAKLNDSKTYRKTY